jgi:hypothetical protein
MGLVHAASVRHALLVSLWIIGFSWMVAAVVPQAAYAQLPPAPLVFTRAEGPHGYGVYLSAADGTRQLASLTVDAHVNARTVELAVSATGARVALLGNFDTRTGTHLYVVEVARPRLQLLEQGSIASAAWDATGTQLAYVLLAQGQAELRVSDAVTPGRPVATFAAARVRVLGWSPDGRDLYVVRSSDTPQGPRDAVAIVNLHDGRVREVVTSAAPGPFITDVRLLRRHDGAVRVSYIRSDSREGCGGTSTLVVATVEGVVERAYGTTPHQYIAAQWSADGEQVAYELRGCVAGQQRDAAAAQRIAEANGVYVANVRTQHTEQRVRGALGHYRIGMVDGTTVQLVSPTAGVTALAAGSTVDAAVLDPPMSLARGPAPAFRNGGPPAEGTTVRNIPVPYLHQLWDTADDFDGRSACGPTTAVMALAGQVLAPWPMEVSVPERHASAYSQYISRVYTYKGVTYDRQTPDRSDRPAYGAYGYMVTDPQIGTEYWRLTRYLEHHVGARAVREAEAEAAWIKDRLDEGHVVLASGTVNGLGHLVLITGYRTDDTYIVHDPYGNGTDGSNDGGSVIYSWNQMALRHVWAVPHPTVRLMVPWAGGNGS